MFRFATAVGGNGHYSPCSSGKLFRSVGWTISARSVAALRMPLSTTETAGKNKCSEARFGCTGGEMEGAEEVERLRAVSDPCGSIPSLALFCRTQRCPWGESIRTGEFYPRQLLGAVTQSRSRRQQVMPEPHLSSCGSISQGMPPGHRLTVTGNRADVGVRYPQM